jgi:hypothetical protein
VFGELLIVFTSSVSSFGVEFLFLTALDGGEWSASLPGLALAPGKGPLGVPQSRSGQKNAFASAGDRTLSVVVHLVAR